MNSLCCTVDMNGHESVFAKVAIPDSTFYSFSRSHYFLG